MNLENAIWKHVSKAITIITIVWLSNPIPKNVERRYIQKCAYLHTHTKKEMCTKIFLWGHLWISTSEISATYKSKRLETTSKSNNRKNVK